MWEEERPSYYANIPAEVRYDKDLSPNAKLLYGEITALSNAKGYCWAGNKYFADLYDVSIKSVSRWISQLVEKGYLTSELKYKANSKEVDSRILSLNTIYNGYGQKSPDLRTKLSMPMDKKVKDNTTSNITSNKRHIVGKPDKAEKKGERDQKEMDLKNSISDTEKIPETEKEKRQLVEEIDLLSELGSSGSLQQVEIETTKKTVNKAQDKIPYDEIIGYLNAKSGKRYKAVEGNKKWIRSRWGEGYTLEDFKKVIDIKSSDWKEDPKMAIYLRPSTLFGNKFDVYLNERQLPAAGVRDTRPQDFIDF